MRGGVILKIMPDARGRVNWRFRFVFEPLGYLYGLTLEVPLAFE